MNTDQLEKLVLIQSGHIKELQNELLKQARITAHIIGTLKRAKILKISNTELAK